MNRYLEQLRWKLSEATRKGDLAARANLETLIEQELRRQRMEIVRREMAN